jgi:predicted transcriptional regulator
MTRRAHPADVFSAIAEPRRREVIAVLSNGQEYAVNEIVLRMKMAQPAVSKHLGALRKGFERYWTHQVSRIKQRAESKAKERTIRLHKDPNQKEEE